MEKEKLGRQGMFLLKYFLVMIFAAALYFLTKIIAGNFGLEFRSGFSKAALLICILCSVVFALLALLLLAKLLGVPGMAKLARAGIGVGMLVILLGELAVLAASPLIAAFCIPEERTVLIDGERYTARIETTGFETTGISYHKQRALVFCDQAGRETEFDYELWQSYK